MEERVYLSGNKFYLALPHIRPDGQTKQLSRERFRNWKFTGAPPPFLKCRLQVNWSGIPHHRINPL
jgi:hypothetical protein